MKRNHLGEDKCVTVFSPWLHRLGTVEETHPSPTHPPADETRRQSSEIQVAARRRSTFLVYVCARRRLSEILAAFAFQVKSLGLSDGVSRKCERENKAG